MVDICNEVWRTGWHTIFSTRNFLTSPDDAPEFRTENLWKIIPFSETQPWLPVFLVFITRDAYLHYYSYHERYTPKKLLSRSNSRQFKHALHISGVFIVFSVLVVRVVPENACGLSTFSLLLDKPNFKNPCSCLFRFEHAKLVYILKFTTGPYCIFRGIPFKSVELTCARSGNLCNIICKYKLFDIKMNSTKTGP